MATRRNNAADKEPTKTLLVYQAIVAADDFITAAQLIERLAGKANRNQIGAALHHMKNRHAIDCMEGDGKLWWYSTPDLDDRSRIVVEKVVESDPRRTRGAATVPKDKTRAGINARTNVVKLNRGLSQSLREANEIADRFRNSKKG